MGVSQHASDFVHMSENMMDMELNPSLWISLLNGVFVSIAFMIWHLFNVDSESANLTVDDASDVKKEEERKDDVTKEEKHLYIIPSLRTKENILRYGDYCNNTSESEQKLSSQQYNEIPPTESENGKFSKEEKSGAQVFKWPLHDNLMEQLRSTNQLSITETLRSKLIENGIQRSNSTTANNQQDQLPHQIKMSEIARQTGKKLTKKQVCVIFDRFEATSRPGLEHTNSASPKQNRTSSPRIRKPIRMDKNEKNKSDKTSIQKRKGLVGNFTENINCKKSFIRTV